MIKCFVRRILQDGPDGLRRQGFSQVHNVVVSQAHERRSILLQCTMPRRVAESASGLELKHRNHWPRTSHLRSALRQSSEASSTFSVYRWKGCGCRLSRAARSPLSVLFTVVEGLWLPSLPTASQNNIRNSEICTRSNTIVKNCAITPDTRGF